MLARSSIYDISEILVKLTKWYPEAWRTNEEQVHETNDEINQPITNDEITKVIKGLKNNKANGIDFIVNEHIKSTVDTMLPIYTKLFNTILDTGLVPEIWTIGVIKPIYKKNGDSNDPANYRPITLLSCFR